MVLEIFVGQLQLDTNGKKSIRDGLQAIIDFGRQEGVTKYYMMGQRGMFGIAQLLLPYENLNLPAEGTGCNRPGLGGTIRGQYIP